MATDTDYPAIFGAMPTILPLVAGDRLTRAEFERRWAAMPTLKCAELIEGVVHMAAAVRYKQHGQPHALLIHWLSSYVVHTRGVETCDNTSIRLDQDNEPQPDCLLRINERFGGQSRVSADGYLEGAPELIAEVSASTSSIDLHDKLHVYRRHGVREYIVWRVLENALDWFTLQDGVFVPLPPVAEQIYHSEVFPGLWLNASALLRGDGKAVLATLQQGLDSPAHAEFEQGFA